MESDEGLRTLGGVVAELTKQAKGDNELQARMTSEPVLVFGAVSKLLAGILQRNKDDVLLTHYHSGSRDDDYGLDPDRRKNGTCDFEVKSDRVALTLRLRVAEP